MDDFGTSAVCKFMLAAVAILLVVLYRCWMYSRKELYEYAAQMPFPEGVKMFPILGHALHFMGSPEDILKNIKRFNHCHLPCQVWLGHKLMTLITRPEDLEVVFNSPLALDKNEMYDFFQSVFGNGLVTSSGAVWKRNRKLIMPIFNQKVLDGFVELFQAQGEELLVEIGGMNGKTFDIGEKINVATMEVVRRTVLGFNENDDATTMDYYYLNKRILELLTTRVFNIFQHSDFIYGFSRNSKELNKCIQKYNNITKTVIAERKLNYSANKQDFAETGDFRTKRALVDHLLEYCGSLSDEDLLYQLNTFIIAGSDTAARASSFLCLMLAIHQDVQEKVCAEINAIVGPSKEIEHSDLPRLTYLDKVIKETMRLFPAGPILFRKVSENLKLETCTIPKGTSVMLATFLTHRSPVHFKNPEKFDPSHFDAEEVEKRHPYAYYPYTLGLRKCIGSTYGKMLIKTLMVMVLRKFKLETDYEKIEEIRLEETLILDAVGGFPVRAIPREP